MKITLISPYPDVTVFGLRTISAYLKKQGHKTRLIFLPDPYGDDLEFGKERYEKKVMDETAELCRDSDLIGVTLMTNFFDGATQITKAVKRATKAPVIWGGVHPTIRPEECLEHADIVCVGEGEEAIAELAGKLENGEDYSTIQNLWLRKDGGVIKNPLRPVTRDLDVYPVPDYSGDEHYVMENDGLARLTPDSTKNFLERGTVSRYLGMIGYQTMTSRGCPYSCTYCINDTLNSMYGSGKLRWRSTAHVIDELVWVKTNMPYVRFIWISDDEFMARKADSLREFCEIYKAKIGLPFTCLISPLSVTEEKMEMLVDAGLVYVQMGIESGSERMQQIFNRRQMNNDRMMKAIKIINRFSDKMRAPSYDFLLDSPYETEQDKLDSLRFIARIPKPYRLQPFRLILYPGTKLYQDALKSGLIANEQEQIYGKTYTMREPNYTNLLMTLARTGKFPSGLLRFLTDPPVANILNSAAMKPFFRALYISLGKVKKLAKKLAGKK